MNYAIIMDGIVTNVIYLLPGNEKEFPNAVNIKSLAVQIGDTYKDGRFYRDGELICSFGEQLSDAQVALSIIGYTEEK